MDRKRGLPIMIYKIETVNRYIYIYICIFHKCVYAYVIYHSWRMIYIYIYYIYIGTYIIHKYYSYMHTCVYMHVRREGFTFVTIVVRWIAFRWKCGWSIPKICSWSIIPIRTRQQDIVRPIGTRSTNKKNATKEVLGWQAGPHPPLKNNHIGKLRAFGIPKQSLLLGHQKQVVKCPRRFSEKKKQLH